MTDQFTHLDAAYAMGALEPAEAVNFERHLHGCRACRTQLDEARSTVALLAVLPGPGRSEQPPDTLLPGLLRRARQERRRHTRFTAAVAALSAACLVVLASVVWDGLRAGKQAQPSANPVALTAVHKNIPVEATALLTDRPWGTQITVHCRYEEGVKGARPYRLRVIDHDGDADDAGSWTILAGQEITYTGGTAVRRERIAKVQVTLPDGTPILQLVL